MPLPPSSLIPQRGQQQEKKADSKAPNFVSDLEPVHKQWLISSRVPLCTNTRASTHSPVSPLRHRAFSVALDSSPLSAGDTRVTNSLAKKKKKKKVEFITFFLFKWTVSSVNPLLLARFGRRRKKAKTPGWNEWCASLCVLSVSHRLREVMSDKNDAHLSAL